MDPGLVIRALGLLLLAAGPVRADLYLCVDVQGHRIILDKPCRSGQRTDAQVKESGSRAAPPVVAGKTRTAAAGAPAIEVGIRKNKTVICQLLDGEKRDTEAQLRGEKLPPAGESPKDNLVKIERQRSRVGCDAAG